MSAIRASGHPSGGWEGGRSFRKETGILPIHKGCVHAHRSHPHLWFQVLPALLGIATHSQLNGGQRLCMLLFTS